MGTTFLVSWSTTGGFTNSSFPFDKQQEYLAELQELCTINLPTLVHSRLRESAPATAHKVGRPIYRFFQ